jgi:hypothetical protein
VTLEELRRDTKLTPQRFAGYFADFDYKFHEEVQSPGVFLSTRSGDCDDYATLAALVLGEKGYRTRLIAVRMPGLTHVVCYVTDTKSYLDYNNRIYLKRTVSSEDSLPAIAKSVAASFSASWTSVSEFTFTNGLKRMVSTVAKTEAYAASVPKPATPTRKLDLDF